MSVQAIFAAANGVSGILVIKPQIYFNADYTYIDFISHNNLVDNLKNAMTFSILRSAGIALITTSGDPPSIAEAILPATTISDVVQKGKRWTLELIACYQVKPLSENNLNNYFRSKGIDSIPWKADEILRYLASNLPPFSSNDGYEELVSSSVFLQYHTSASSNASLCRRAEESFPFDKLFTDEEQDAISDSFDHPYDMEKAKSIDGFTLVKTSAVLEACGILPSNWYMGKKAVQSYPVSSYNNMVKHVRKAIALREDYAGLESITDVDLLGDKINALFKVGESDEA